MNNSICEYCGKTMDQFEPMMVSCCVVRQKEDMYEFTIRSCSTCYGLIQRNQRDFMDRVTFPDNTQIALYKIKRYLYPSKKKEKELESWKLFSPLKSLGKKKTYLPLEIGKKK